MMNGLKYAESTEKQKTKQNKFIDTKNRLVVVRGTGWGVGKMGEGGQKVQTSSCKISKSWARDVQHGNYS